MSVQEGMVIGIYGGGDRGVPRVPDGRPQAQAPVTVPNPRHCQLQGCERGIGPSGSRQGAAFGFTEYCLEGECHVAAVPAAPLPNANPINLWPSSGPSLKCSSASASLPGGTFTKTGAAPDTSSPCNPARVGVRRPITTRLPRSRERSSREPVV